MRIDVYQQCDRCRCLRPPRELIQVTLEAQGQTHKRRQCADEALCARLSPCSRCGGRGRDPEHEGACECAREAPLFIKRARALAALQRAEPEADCPDPDFADEHSQSPRGKAK